MCAHVIIAKHKRQALPAVLQHFNQMQVQALALAKDLTVKEFHRLLLMAPSDATLPISIEPIFGKPVFSAFDNTSCNPIVSRDSAWTVVTFGPGTSSVAQMLGLVRELLALPLVDGNTALVAGPSNDGTRRVVDASSWKLAVHCTFESPTSRWLFATDLTPYRRLSDDKLVQKLNDSAIKHDKQTASRALLDICGEFRVRRLSVITKQHTLVLLADGKWWTLKKLVAENKLRGAPVLACLDLCSAPTGHAVATFKEGVTLEALCATYSTSADPVAVVRMMTKAVDCAPIHD